jgi:hypothetical protein
MKVCQFCAQGDVPVGNEHRMKDSNGGVDWVEDCEGWRPIAHAPLAVWGIAFQRAWRRPFPAMRNGDNGAVYVDTCEPEAKGWQTHADFWMPALDLPV